MSKTTDVAVREEINWLDSVPVLFDKMSENNERASGIVRDIFCNCPTKGVDILLQLDTMNIRGEQILFLFDSYCQYNIKKMVMLIEKQDIAMINFVNDVAVKNKYPHRACFFGKKRECFDFD